MLQLLIFAYPITRHPRGYPRVFSGAWAGPSPSASLCSSAYLVLQLPDQLGVLCWSLSMSFLYWGNPKCRCGCSLDCSLTCDKWFSQGENHFSQPLLALLRCKPGPPGVTGETPVHFLQVLQVAIVSASSFQCLFFCQFSCHFFSPACLYNFQLCDFWDQLEHKCSELKNK